MKRPTKEEVVYATFSSGSIDSIYVVNEFYSESQRTIVDYGNYSEVNNLSNTLELKQEEDRLSIDVEPGTFYYKGTLEEQQLPWDFTIEYYLDGKKLSADEIAGKSGELEIRITSKQNNKIDSTFYDNYLLQITTTFGADTSKNIKSEGATIANEGKSKTVVHSIMPETDADISITASVSDFEMDGIQLAALPFSMAFDVPDTSELSEEMSTLSLAIEEINGGVAEISSGSVSLGLGATELASGSADFNNGLSYISTGSSDLVEGSASIQLALSTIATGLENSDEFDLSSLAQLPETFRTLAAVLDAMGSSLELSEQALAGLDEIIETALENLPDTDSGPSYNNIQALIDENPGDTADAATAELDTLLTYYAAVQQTKATYLGLQGILGELLAMSNLGIPSHLFNMSDAMNDLADTIELALADNNLDSMADLIEGLKTLSGEYDTFHTGLSSYTEGVDLAASSYQQLHDGVLSLSGGIDELSGGLQELYVGTSALEVATREMPDEMQAKIDEFMADYQTKDFDHVSFVSKKNKGVKLVQFVFTTEGVSIESEPVADAPEEEKSSFLDQIINLFS